MVTIQIVLVVAAFVLFVLAAIGVPSAPRFNLTAAGLACCTLAYLSRFIVT